MRTVLVCILGAVTACSMVVNVVLRYRVLDRETDTRQCAQTLRDLYKVAEYQRGLVVDCLSELENTAQCYENLARCRGLK